jgi:hypothetical protein
MINKFGFLRLNIEFWLIFHIDLHSNIVLPIDIDCIVPMFVFYGFLQQVCIFLLKGLVTCILNILIKKGFTYFFIFLIVKKGNSGELRVLLVVPWTKELKYTYARNMFLEVELG